MDVTPERVDASHRPVLANLLQLHQHDFMDFTPFEDAPDLDETGRFDSGYFELFWKDCNVSVFVIRVDERIAGFAVVDINYHEAAEANTRGIRDFFVTRKYRKQNVGRRAATELFDMFPGKWQVGQVWLNTPAQTFWRKVIGDYTKGNFTEGQNQYGPHQKFENGK